MRLPLRLSSFLLAGLVASACSSSAPTGPAVSLDIVAARTLWQRVGLRNYVFTSSHGCFCDPTHSATMRVTVQNGIVTSVIDSATGAVRPVSYRQPVDSIFAFLERSALQYPSQVTVEFDPTYGYPRSALVGSLAADAGFAFTISSLRPLP